MTVYETLSIMFLFGNWILQLLTIVMAMLIYKHTKK